MYHRSIVPLLFGTFVALSGWHAWRETRADQVDEFMRAKLGHSQKVLEGLATEDYDLIVKHGKELGALSQAAQWQVLQTPQYLQRSAEFRRAAEALAEAGRKRNLDGAALAYVDVTMKCVECHKYVRSVRQARQESPGRAKTLVVAVPATTRSVTLAVPKGVPGL